MNLQRRLAAEGVGTAPLLTAVAGSGILGERLAGGNVAIALLANAIATGSTLVALIPTFGPISGAHFNPAVTIADASQSGLSWRDVPLYIAAQLIVAVVGVLAAHLMFGEKLFQFSQHVRAGGAQPFSELVATFGLLAVIWGCSRRRSESVPLADWSLHHGSVLIYGIDVICKPNSHRRASPDEHVCWHPPGRHSGLHRRPTRGRSSGDPLLPLARSSIDD